MAELADAPDLESGTNRCVGSSPITRTKMTQGLTLSFFVWVQIFIQK